MFNNNNFDVCVFPIISKRSGEAVRNQYDIVLTTYDITYHIFQSYETKCAIFTFDMPTTKKTLKVFKDAFLQPNHGKIFCSMARKHGILYRFLLRFGEKVF